MVVGLDGTPLLGQRTGIGRYVHELLAHWPYDDESVVVTAFTTRGGHALAEQVPPAVRVRRVPVPARLLQALWARAETPPVTALCGRVEVFHGTNFVLPPTGSAAGVVTVHDLSYLRTPETVSAASARYRALVPRSLARAAVVCTPSSAVADEVVDEYGVDRGRVVVTPLGVRASWSTVDRPSPRWLADRGLPERYFLCLGAHEPRKDLGTATEAHRRARAERPDLPALVHVGPPGWGDRGDVDGLVQAGYRGDDELPAIVAGATALLFPSRYEGFGLPPLEAFATGTAVVASDLPVVREVTGDLATLVPVGDVDAWADALLEAADQATDPDDDGAARRRAHAAGFTWSRCVADTRAAHRLAASSR